VEIQPLGCRCNLSNDVTGKYTTKLGESWESISLPGKKEDYRAFKIEVLEDIPVVQSKATKWFENGIGGGHQNKFGESMAELAESDPQKGIKSKLKLMGEIK